jgi:serine phosphatase RsbU (regulator of sigma subunit)
MAEEDINSVAFHRGEAFGVQRMEEGIRAFRDSAPREIIANLHQNVLKFANRTRQQDDLTAVIIKRM